MAAVAVGVILLLALVGMAIWPPRRFHRWRAATRPMRRWLFPSRYPGFK